MDTTTFIYDLKEDENVPEGFAAVMIRVDAGVKSDLSWGSVKEKARRFIEQGLSIFWELDLGIFSGLNHPLTHGSQFLSLKLSVEHFRDTLWKEFKDHSIGVSLYRGSTDFTQGWVWDEDQEPNLKEWLLDHFSDEKIDLEDERGKMILQLYCRDALGEYLDLLANRLAGECPAFILFDENPIEHPVHLENLLSKEHFYLFTLLFTDKDFGRSLPKKGDSKSANMAICLPSLRLFEPSEYGVFEEVFGLLSKNQIPLRVIPEGLLTTEWEGLDTLIVSPENMTTEGDRMVQGFIAAGGEVISVKEKDKLWEKYDSKIH